jgi:hypothetical protein
MKSLTVGTSFELKDKKDLSTQFTDIKLFTDIHGVISGSWLVDRSGATQLPFRTTLGQNYLLPDFETINNLTLEECCVNRARKLLSSNQTLYFLYSGGIDSTLGLISFINATPNTSQIIVVCNNESIRENPNFYHNYIKLNFKLMATELFMQRIKTQILDGIVISCEHGDLLYGQDFGSVALTWFGEEYLKAPPTRENILKFFKAGKMSTLGANCWFDLFSSNIHLSARPINTVYDFFWWTGFNWRWQWAGEKIKLRTAMPINVETFFSSLEFQKWSVNHTQHSIKKASDFKYDYKEIIFNFTKDQEYQDLKIKHVSTSLYYLTNAFVAVESDGTKLTKKDYALINYYQPDNFISNWLKDNHSSSE